MQCPELQSLGSSQRPPGVFPPRGLVASAPASAATPLTEDGLARTTSISTMARLLATVVVDPAAITWPAASPSTSQTRGMPASSFRR